MNIPRTSQKFKDHYALLAVCRWFWRGGLGACSPPSRRVFGALGIHQIGKDFLISCINRWLRVWGMFKGCVVTLFWTIQRTKNIPNTVHISTCKETISKRNYSSNTYYCRCYVGFTECLLNPWSVIYLQDLVLLGLSGQAWFWTK